MGSRLSSPGPQQRRFAAYIEGLANAAGHADRHTPLKNYCTGLLLPGERKSVEPMAARLAPDNVRRMHQSLHHLVADAPWNDQEMLAEVRRYVLPTMEKHGPVVAWIVDDTGFPKQGKHSVGVARQYCGQVGKQDNCQVAVSLSVSTWGASLPMAWRLYLPEGWCQDFRAQPPGRSPRTDGIPNQARDCFAADSAGAETESSRRSGVGGCRLWERHAIPRRAHPTGTAICGGHRVFDHGLETGTTTPAGASAKTRPGFALGAPPKRLRRNTDHQPIAAKQLALGLPCSAWKDIGWRQGSQKALRSRFAAVRVRPAHRDYKRTEPHLEEWLLIEWPKTESEPTKYWLSTLPVKTSLKSLVKTAKHRWIIERDYEELKQELGLGHYEGRSWRGFHHHATLCIAA